MFINRASNKKMNEIIIEEDTNEFTEKRIQDFKND